MFHITKIVQAIVFGSVLMLAAAYLSAQAAEFRVDAAAGRDGDIHVDGALASDWPNLALVPIRGDYNQPVHLTNAGDGSGRIFVVEKAGIIQVIDNGRVLATPFLDISDRVNSSCSECGLLSLAFPPDFASKRYFFVYYTSAENKVGPGAEGEPDGSNDSIVARFRLDSDPNHADAASEEEVLAVNQPYTNHNGGQIAFAPDGTLYIGLGDGGRGGDPLGTGQRTDTLLGKILRVRVEEGEYSIPADNPFAQSAQIRKEIWALGLRNPWRFSFDQQTGDLYIGDVGQGTYEEINHQPASAPGGTNYGWNVMEGTHCYQSSTCEQDTLTLPVAEYGHDMGCSVTGGVVYRGPYLALNGVYLYGDYCFGNIWGLRQSGGSWQSELLLSTSLSISSFGEDEAGHVYVLDYRGKIYRIWDGVPADLSIEKRGARNNLGLGTALTYTLTITNSGPGPAQDVMVSDTLPLSVTYGGLVRTSEGIVQPDASIPVWYVQGLEPGAHSIVFTATVDSSVTGPIINRAEITSTTPLVDAEELSATHTILLSQAAGTVEGSVIDSEGKGIAGATVSLATSARHLSMATLVFPLTTLTGAEGGYRFENVPLGKYMLSVTLPGEAEPVHSQTVDVGSEAVKTVDPIVVSSEEDLYLPAIQR